MCRWWSRLCTDSRPSYVVHLGSPRCYTQSSSPSLCTDVLGYHRASFHGAGRHVHARSLSRRRVLPRILRVPPPRIYRLCAWPLLAVDVPADYTFFSIYYDLVASIIASSLTILARLLHQPRNASAPLFAAFPSQPS
jgi:hypothetical protein